MKHVRTVLEELRRYISGCEDRSELEEVDTLLGVALEEVRRKIKMDERKERGQPHLTGKPP